MARYPARERFTRFLGEVSIIVIGVLIALSVDSWREARRDSESQQFLLASLLSETTTNIDSLRAAIDYNDGIVGGLRQLVAIHYGRQPMPPRDSANWLLMIAVSYNRVTPTFGVYDAMIATGSTRLLPSSALAQRLAAHRARLEAGMGDEGSALHVIELVSELMTEYGGGYQFMPPFITDRLELPALEAPADFAGLISDARFGDLMFRRTLLEDNVGGFYRDQAELLEGTKALIEQATR